MWYQFGKRELDIVISIGLLILFSPLLIIVSIAIKLESRGPILFKQIRVAKYESYQLRKYDILPGITGLSQITGRKDFSFGEKGNQDLHYVAHVNLLLDMKIMLKTLPAILAGRGAY